MQDGLWWLMVSPWAAAALNVLHEHVTSKRTHNSPITSLNFVVLLLSNSALIFLETAKDDLYQCENIARNTNVGIIEVGILVQEIQGHEELT